ASSPSCSSGRRRRSSAPPPGSGAAHRPPTSPPSVIANPLLWFIQHHLYDLNTEPNLTRRETDAFRSGYAPSSSRRATAGMLTGDDRGDVAAFDALLWLVEQRQLALARRVAVRS